MAVNLSIKNVPEAMANAIKARANANHRSLQGELMALLEAAVQQRTNDIALKIDMASDGDAADPDHRGAKLSVVELNTRLRQIVPIATSLPPGTSAVEIVRRMRDGRDGTQWQDPDHHSKGY
jgi:antitoxin FitA